MTEMRQIERADLLLAVFGKLLRTMFFKNSIFFVADGEAVKYDGTERSVVCRDANHERPSVVCSDQASHPRFSRESQNLMLEEDVNHDRTGRPVFLP